MEASKDLVSDLVRLLLGRWDKDDDKVWRFTRARDGDGKCIRFIEGDGVVAVKEKVFNELNIDRATAKVELMYDMPGWMDVDESVKPVPIHTVTNDDIDLFLAMRVDIHEMKLYVVSMPLNMTLEIDGFMVVPILDEYSFAEVMSKDEIEEEKQKRANKEAIDNVICTQLPLEHVADRDDCWVGHSYAVGGFATLSAALRHYKDVIHAEREKGSPVIVLNPKCSSSADENANRVARLTRDLFTDFEKAACTSDATGSQTYTQNQISETEIVAPPILVIANPNTNHTVVTPIPEMLRLLEIPVQTFTKDATPVVDDTDLKGGDRTRLVLLDVDYEGDELFIGRVFKSKDNYRVNIAVHAINIKFSFRNEGPRVRW